MREKKFLKISHWIHTKHSICMRDHASVILLHVWVMVDGRKDCENCCGLFSKTVVQCLPSFRTPLCLSPAVILNILIDFTTFTGSERCNLDKGLTPRRDSTLFMAPNDKLLGTSQENHHLPGGPTSLGRLEHRRREKPRKSQEVGYSSADCLWTLEKRRWM